MNTTASFSSVAETSWSDLRRCSTETIFSIQGKETDFVRDTSDTEWFGSDGDAAVEYEPASELDDDGPLSGDSSGHSDNEIIATKVIEVSVGDDGELQLADSELTASSSDSEMDLHDYWLCAHCRAQNNNPMYRYCEKCFKERKNFFPPRPKRKRKRKRSPRVEPEPLPRTLSQDSGVESAANSQELSQVSMATSSQSSVTESTIPISQTSSNSFIRTHLKRRAESAGGYSKRIKIDYSDSESDTDSGASISTNSKCNTTDSLVKTAALETDVPDGTPQNNIDFQVTIDHKINESKTIIDLNKILSTSTGVGPVDEIDGIDTIREIDRNTLGIPKVRPVQQIVSDSELNIDKSISDNDVRVTPLVKMVSDPALTVENIDVKLTKKVIINTLKEKLDIESKELCIVCLAEPKSGVFVHGRIAHICCCYKCAVKVWSKAKRCPVCNCKVSNVLKAVVM